MLNSCFTCGLFSMAFLRCSLLVSNMSTFLLLYLLGGSVGWVGSGLRFWGCVCLSVIFSFSLCQFLLKLYPKVSCMSIFFFLIILFSRSNRLSYLSTIIYSGGYLFGTTLLGVSIHPLIYPFTHPSIHQSPFNVCFLTRINHNGDATIVTHEQFPLYPSLSLLT